jgi:hypothetical protein
MQWATGDAVSCAVAVVPDPGSLSGPVACGSSSTTLSFPANTGSSPETWTVTLTANGAAGTAPASQQVTVTEAAQVVLPPPPAITSLTLCPSVPATGGTCALQWVTADAISCTVTAVPDPGWLSGPVDCAAGLTQLKFPGNFTPAPELWTVTLTAVGAVGTSPATATVSLTEPPR